MTDDHLLTTPEIKRRYATFLHGHGVDPRLAMDSDSLRDDIKQAVSAIEDQPYAPSVYDKRILHVFRNRR
jgi:hypothetical protein